jgi:hypothetical protein
MFGTSKSQHKEKPDYLWFALIALGFSPATALAYLDPTTGSMLISAVVGLVASLVLAGKTYWYRIKSFFKRKVTGPGTENGQS